MNMFKTIFKFNEEYNGRKIYKRKDLTDDECDRLNKDVKSLKNGDFVKIIYYQNFKYIKEIGNIKIINFEKKIIKIEKEIINFEDIYSISRNI